MVSKGKTGWWGIRCSYFLAGFITCDRRGLELVSRSYKKEFYQWLNQKTVNLLNVCRDIS